MKDGLRDYEVVLNNSASILECKDVGDAPKLDYNLQRPFCVYDFKVIESRKELSCKVYAFDKIDAKRIARNYVLDYLEEQGIITRDAKSYIIVTDPDNVDLKVLHKYPCSASSKRKSKIVHQDKYSGYAILDVYARTEESALEIARKLLKSSTHSILDKFDFQFPKIVQGTPSQITGATIGRTSYISDHMERMVELTEKLNPSDKWNWSVLYELRVTSQEYVVLFSKNACDMYARGICDKYYHGEWKEEQYGDAFE